MEATVGGTARHLIDVVRHTPGVRHHVAIPRRRVGWTGGDMVSALVAESAAGVHVVEMRRSPPHPRNALGLLAVRQLIRELRPDIVHGHSSVGGALARLAKLGEPGLSFYTPHALTTGAVGIYLERRLGPLVDRFVAVSESEAELVRRLRLVPTDRILVIPNGIDLAPPTGGIDLRERLGVPSHTRLVGSVGRLMWQKGPEVFVRACAVVAGAMPSVHFVLIGSGPLQKRVEREIDAAGLPERFSLLTDFDAAASVVGQLDVFVSASRFEGGPYAPLEAMRAGVPVVLTDAVGNRDVVEPRVSGMLAPIDDARAIAVAVGELLSNDSLHRSIAAAGQLRVRERFDVREMGAALSRAYMEALASNT